ncbi:hypothetical protein V8G54_022611 [Vigna mungo]|uniref:Uncharacterized protein n=1 Tax=Vigna mungo TaxID=3915 RepID=A0AAQ3N3E5_VIGMU
MGLTYSKNANYRQAFTEGFSALGNFSFPKALPRAFAGVHCSRIAGSLGIWWLKKLPVEGVVAIIARQGIPLSLREPATATTSGGVPSSLGRLLEEAVVEGELLYEREKCFVRVALYVE